jgi:hypothetical protein
VISIYSDVMKLSNFHVLPPRYNNMSGMGGQKLNRSQKLTIHVILTNGVVILNSLANSDHLNVFEPV